MFTQVCRSVLNQSINQSVSICPLLTTGTADTYGQDSETESRPTDHCHRSKNKYINKIISRSLSPVRRTEHKQWRWVWNQFNFVWSFQLGQSTRSSVSCCSCFVVFVVLPLIIVIPVFVIIIIIVVVVVVVTLIFLAIYLVTYRLSVSWDSAMKTIVVKTSMWE